MKRGTRTIEPDVVKLQTIGGVEIACIHRIDESIRRQLFRPYSDVALSDRIFDTFELPIQPRVVMGIIRGDRIQQRRTAGGAVRQSDIPKPVRRPGPFHHSERGRTDRVGDLEESYFRIFRKKHRIYVVMEPERMIYRKKGFVFRGWICRLVFRQDVFKRLCAGRHPFVASLRAGIDAIAVQGVAAFLDIVVFASADNKKPSGVVQFRRHFIKGFQPVRNGSVGGCARFKFPARKMFSEVGDIFWLQGFAVLRVHPHVTVLMYLVVIGENYKIVPEPLVEKCRLLRECLSVRQQRVHVQIAAIPLVACWHRRNHRQTCTCRKSGR